MTELNSDPTDRHPVHRDDGVATVTNPAVPDLEAPNYATTDVDPTPGSTPGHEVHGLSDSLAAHPAVDTGRPDTLPPRGR